MTHASLFVGSLVAPALLLAGCQKAPEAQQEAAQAAPVTMLPVSINAAMVGLTDQSSDYLFAPGNGDMPKNDHDWNLVHNAAYEMMLAGAVIQIPGTGEHDAQWVAEDDWKKLANQLTEVGGEAEKLAASRSTDQSAWRAVGDKLVQTCLDCHDKFKPETPSQGILHEATKRESLGETVFPPS